MSGPHIGVFGRKNLCNSRIYLLPKDAEIIVVQWIISCRSIWCDDEVVDFVPVLCKNTDLRCELLVIFFIDMYYLLLSDIKDVITID